MPVPEKKNYCVSEGETMEGDTGSLPSLSGSAFGKETGLGGQWPVLEGPPLESPG